MPAFVRLRKEEGRIASGSETGIAQMMSEEVLSRESVQRDTYASLQAPLGCHSMGSCCTKGRKAGWLAFAGTRIWWNLH